MQRTFEKLGISLSLLACTTLVVPVLQAHEACLHLGGDVECPHGVAPGSQSIQFLFDNMGNPTGIRWLQPDNTFVNNSVVNPAPFVPHDHNGGSNNGGGNNGGNNGGSNNGGFGANNTQEQRGLTLGPGGPGYANPLNGVGGGMDFGGSPFIQLDLGGAFAGAAQPLAAPVTEEEKALAAIAAVLDYQGASFQEDYEENLEIFAGQHQAEAERERPYLEQEQRIAQDEADRLQRIADAQLKHTGLRLRNHYDRLADRLLSDGEGYHGLQVQRFQKSAALVMQDAYVGGLVQSLAQLNTIKRGSGEIAEGSFLADPQNAVRTLTELNRELGFLRESDPDSPRIAEIEQQIQTLLTINGVAENEQLTQLRTNLLGQLDPLADNISSKYTTFVVAEQEYNAWESAKRQYQNAVSQPPPGSNESAYKAWEDHLANLQQTIEAGENSYQIMVQARTAYLQSLNSSALLTAPIKLGDFEGPYWKWLSMWGPDHAQSQQALDLAIISLENTLRELNNTNGTIVHVEPLLDLFASPLYAPLRQQVSVQLGGVYPALGPMLDSLPSLYQAHMDDTAFSQMLTDAALAGAQIVVVGVMVIFPVTIPVLGPVELALLGTQAGVQGARVIVAWQDLSAAEQAAQGGVGTTFVALANYEDLLQAHAGTFVLTVVLAPLDIASTVGAIQAAKVARLEVRALEAGTEAIQTAQAGRAALVEVTDANGILRRVNWRGLKGANRIHEAGDMSFYVNQGLGPKTTVQSGGHTFHLSQPFDAGGGRTAVIAWQELADGSVMPRTFYLSNEHGMWRAASGGFIAPGLGGTIAKGPTLPGTTRYANELAVDLTGDLQPALWQHLQNEGVLVDLSSDVQRTAFFGHLQDAQQDFLKLVTLEDVSQPLVMTPAKAPDLLNPVSTWDITAGFYQGGTGRLLRSPDGTEYVVIEVMLEGERRVFTSSIQNADAAITPFGTRAQAFDVKLPTPTRHIQRGDRLPFVPGTDDEYVFDFAGTNTPLNNWLAQNLPDTVSPGAVAAGGARPGSLGSAADTLPMGTPPAGAGLDDTVIDGTVITPPGVRTGPGGTVIDDTVLAPPGRAALGETVIDDTVITPPGVRSGPGQTQELTESQILGAGRGGAAIDPPATTSAGQITGTAVTPTPTGAATRGPIPATAAGQAVNLTLDQRQELHREVILLDGVRASVPRRLPQPRGN